MPRSPSTFFLLHALGSFSRLVFSQRLSAFLPRLRLIIDAPWLPSPVLALSPHPQKVFQRFVLSVPPRCTLQIRFFFDDCFYRRLIIDAIGYPPSPSTPLPVKPSPTLEIPLFYPDGLADHEVALFYGPKGNLLFVPFLDASLSPVRERLFGQSMPRSLSILLPASRCSASVRSLSSAAAFPSFAPFSH